MSRFLFVVTHFAGHVNPAVSVAMELEERGHEVAWVGPSRIRGLLPEGADVLPAGDDVTERFLVAFDRLGRRGSSVGEDVKCLWEELLVPLAREMVPDVAAAVEAIDPDALVVDQQAFAGALVARKRSRRWATLGPTPAVFRQFVEVAGPRPDAWFISLLDSLQREAGLEPVRWPDLSPHLVVAFTTGALVGDPSLPSAYRLVGPGLEHRLRLVDRESFPWDALADRRRVLVALGTVVDTRGKRLIATVLEALDDLDVQVIVAASPESLPELPADVIARPHLPQLALLPEVDAVVCHGGQNTVCEALAHGLPLVVAPITFDQPIVAQQVVAAGAGVRVRSGRTSAAELRGAVEAVLTDPSYREAAGRVQASFREAGGARRAADELEGLVA